MVSKRLPKVLLGVITSSILGVVILGFFPRYSVAVSPSQTATQIFPLGVFEDLNQVPTTAAMESMLLDIKSRGMDTVFFTNGFNRQASLLNTTDALNMNVVWSYMGELYPRYYDNSVQRNYQTARTLVQESLAVTSTHPSVIGYNIVDDATWQRSEKIADVVAAHKELDASRPAAPMLVGSPNTEKVAQKSNSAFNVTYNYPARDGTPACGFAQAGVSDIVVQLRSKKQFLSPNTPLWVVLQTHETAGSVAPSLRKPTVEELRIQNWVSIGEGAKGIFWFIYSTQQSWVGLEDESTLMAEVTDLTRRVSPLRPILLKTQQINDIFYTRSAQAAYVSTLFDRSTNKYYAVVVNHACTPENIEIYSSSLYGRLKNVETNTIHPLGTAIPFRGGDGALFELIDMTPVAAPYAPPKTTNLVANGSFESLSNGFFSNWQPSRTTVTADTTKAKEGRQSARFSGPTAAVALSQTPATLKPNTTYTLSFWSQLSQELEHTNTKPMLYVRLGDSLQQIQIPRMMPHTDWQKTQVVFKTTDQPITFQRLDLLWQLEAGQEFWLDDVTLCEGNGECLGHWPNLTLAETPAPPPQCSGDVNGDSKVDLLDYSVLVGELLKMVTLFTRSDINKDGAVDLRDYSILVSQLLKCP